MTLGEVGGDKRFYVYAMEDGQVNGTMVLDDKDDYTELGTLAVHPNVQACGIGKKLLNFAEENCERPILRLLVFQPRKELIAYYLRRNYVLTGKRILFEQMAPHEYVQPEHDGKLHFVELQKRITLTPESQQ